jgi:hypothetical protein
MSLDVQLVVGVPSNLCLRDNPLCLRPHQFANKKGESITSSRTIAKGKDRAFRLDPSGETATKQLVNYSRASFHPFNQTSLVISYYYHLTPCCDLSVLNPSLGYRPVRTPPYTDRIPQYNNVREHG